MEVMATKTLQISQDHPGSPSQFPISPHHRVPVRQSAFRTFNVEVVPSENPDSHLLVWRTGLATILREFPFNTCLTQTQRLPNKIKNLEENVSGPYQASRLIWSFSKISLAILPCSTFSAPLSAWCLPYPWHWGLALSALRTHVHMSGPLYACSSLPLPWSKESPAKMSHTGMSTPLGPEFNWPFFTWGTDGLWIRTLFRVCT